MSWASSTTKKTKKKKTKVYMKKKKSQHQANVSTGVQTSTGGTDDEDGEWATAGVPGS